jgi:hypothetical protein
MKKSSILGILINSVFLLSMVSTTMARPKPVALFINGDDNCCLHYGKNHVYMEELNQFFEDKGIQVYVTAWNSVDNQWEGSSSMLPGEATPNFINELVKLAESLPEETPLILIGHSFGGDSILQALPSLSNYNIMFVGVIDPVGFGGLRSKVKSYSIPSHVRYFLNRWQTNVPWPIDYLINGRIHCNAQQQCNQEEHNISRQDDGSADKIRCGDLEFGCYGAHFERIETSCLGIPCVSYKWFPGYKNKPVSHTSIAYDPYIKRQILDIVYGLVISYENGDFDNSINSSKVYIDTQYVGLENGSSLHPFNTVVEGVDKVLPYGTVYIRTGNYAETMTIDKPIKLQSISGPITIGNPW